MNTEGDVLTYQISSEPTQPKSVMLQKKWLNMLDLSNGTYNTSQSIIETSVLANSNDFLNYREAYLAVPMILTATNTALDSTGCMTAPATAATSADYAFGLKNSYLSIIHSVSVDLNGVNVVQQTPLCSLWNNFQLLTSLSLDDVNTQGSSIGFYPDNPLAFSYHAAASSAGTGVVNNDVSCSIPNYATQFNSYDTSNEGLLKRIQYINYDADATTGPAGTGSAFSTLQTATYANDLYRSQVFKKQNGTASLYSVYQVQIMGIIKLKHIHNLFNVLPIAKGLQFKIILNLNQTKTTLTRSSGVWTASNNFLAYNGVNPLMFASARVGVQQTTTVLPLNVGSTYAAFPNDGSVEVSLYVGNTCQDSTQKNVSGVTTSSLPSSIQLYVPAYVMNPVLESIYITSNPNKTIVYKDIYQFTTTSVSGGANFSHLITNGIKGLTSILVIPYFTSSVAGGIPYQNIFGAEGGGCTSPLTSISNFNVRVAGQNAIYNLGRYNYENFNNQLYGTNAVNAGLTDGLTSSLINELSFNLSHCYYYVDVARGLPVETTIPKSVEIVGTNKSVLAVQYYVYCEFTNSITVNVNTGLLM